MAVRYTGDVEVRTTIQGRRLTVTVRWPDMGRVRSTTYCADVTGGRPTPAEYDQIARRAVRDVLSWNSDLPVERTALGGFVLRRVFQAPCPR